MSKKVTVNQMADEIARQLAAWNDDVTDGVKDAVKEVAEQCVKEIRENSPVLTGDYKKGWTDMISYESQNDLRVTVHNKTDYQLTHLLEYGHVLKRGGRKIGDVKSKPHIKLAEQHAADSLEKKVKVIVKK